MHRHLRLFALSLLTAVGLTLGSELAAQQLSDDILGKVHYRSIGPTRQGGRYVDFAVPLQDINTMYAATGSGGLWKSVNAGISWEPIFDELEPSRGVGEPNSFIQSHCHRVPPVIARLPAAGKILLPGVSRGSLLHAWLLHSWWPKPVHDG